MAEACSDVTLVSCPGCQGRGGRLDPEAQKIDPVCPMCAGRGRITNKVCACGRPVVWLIDGFEHCNAFECFVRVDKLRQAKADSQARLDGCAL